MSAAQEGRSIAISLALLIRWLVSAALAGVAVGSVLAYLVMPRGGAGNSKLAEAYIDTRTGKVISADSRSGKHQTASAEQGYYQPAFYCWKCRQWLPVENPQKREVPRGGAARAMSARPAAPRPHQNRRTSENTSRKGDAG